MGSCRATAGLMHSAWSEIYVGSYAVMHNYDYRLVFLLLAIPQLLRWGREAAGAVPRANWILFTLASLLLAAARPVGTSPSRRSSIGCSSR